MPRIDFYQIEQISRVPGHALTSETAQHTRIPLPKSICSPSHCSLTSGTSLLSTSGYIQDKASSTISSKGNAIAATIQRGYSTTGSKGKAIAAEIQVRHPDGSTVTLTWRDVIRALDAVDMTSRFEDAGMVDPNLTLKQQIKILHALAGSLLALDQQVGKGDFMITVQDIRDLGFDQDYSELRDLVRQDGDENVNASQASLGWDAERWEDAIPDYAEERGSIEEGVRVVLKLKRLDRLQDKLVAAFSDALKRLGGVKEVHHDFYLPRLEVKKRDAKALSELGELVDKVLDSMPRKQNAGFDLSAQLSRAEDLELKEDHPRHLAQAYIFDKEVHSPQETDAWLPQGSTVTLESTDSLWFPSHDGAREQLQEQLHKLLTGYFLSYGSLGKVYQTVPTGWIRIRVRWTKGSIHR